MQDIVYVLAGTLHGVEVEQISFAEINAMQNFYEVLPPAGGEIIYSPHPFSPLQQRVC